MLPLFYLIIYRTSKLTRAIRWMKPLPFPLTKIIVHKCLWLDTSFFTNIPLHYSDSSLLQPCCRVLFIGSHSCSRNCLKVRDGGNNRTSPNITSLKRGFITLLQLTTRAFPLAAHNIRITQLYSLLSTWLYYSCSSYLPLF